MGRPLRLPAPQRERATTPSAPRTARTSISRRAGHGGRRPAAGRAAAVGRGHRRRRDERRHGLRGAQQRRRLRLRPARDPQRQRDVDLASRWARSTSTSPRCSRRRSTTACAEGGKDVLAKPPPGQGARQAVGGAHEGHGARPARCSRSWASTTSAPSTGTTSTRWCTTLANVREHRRARSSCTSSPRRATATSAPRTTRSSTTASRTFDPAQGIVPQGHAARPAYTQVFGDWLCDMAHADPRVVAHHAGDARGLGAGALLAGASRRYFDVGIAEQHAVTFAAGLACEGMRPVVAIYSTFLQRAYDQLIHDVALQNLPVVFAIDRGGLVGADGPTHHGAFDLSYLRCIPNLASWRPPTRTSAASSSRPRFAHRRARRGALPARQRAGRDDRPRAVHAARGQGRGPAREPPPHPPARDPRLRGAARRGAGGRRGARRHRGQHALREAARRRARARARALRTTPW